MPHFSEEQLAEIATAFGLQRADTLPVKDGQVKRGDKVWWRANTGPSHETVDGTNWNNIEEFPELYSLKEPEYRIQYLD